MTEALGYVACFVAGLGLGALLVLWIEYETRETM